MSFRINKVGAMTLWLLMSMIATQVTAQVSETVPEQVPEQDHAAYALVRDTTKQVMDVVSAADAYVEDDPERYYQQIQGLLDPLIDFRSFARKVMGPYASSKRYRSLDEKGRQELQDQLDRFTSVMRASLVRTYSKGLLAFGGSKIELVPPESGDEAVEGEENSKRLSVRQLVYADRKAPYEVLYQMGQEKSGEWKLLNVIIESVNLGEVYRDQFKASAREQDGNLDAVIQNWSTVVVDVES